MMSPTQQELDALEQQDKFNYEMVMNAGNRFAQPAVPYPYGGRPTSGTMFLNGFGAGPGAPPMGVSAATASGNAGLRAS
eukprot:3315414-Amphidinium_carterae.1